MMSILYRGKEVFVIVFYLPWIRLPLRGLIFLFRCRKAEPTVVSKSISRGQLLMLVLRIGSNIRYLFTVQ